MCPDNTEDKSKKKEELSVAFDNGELNDNDIEIDIAEPPRPMVEQIDFPEGAGHIGMISIGEIIGKNFGLERKKKKKMKVKEAVDIAKIHIE